MFFVCVCALFVSSALFGSNRIESNYADSNEIIQRTAQTNSHTQVHMGNEVRIRNLLPSNYIDI